MGCIFQVLNEKQIKEMREYFKMSAEQNTHHQDHKPFFKVSIVELTLQCFMKIY